MNRHDANSHHSREFSEEWERQLYRLADGELPADERRRLLRQLDERPDGWRRCALAFLENQAFAQDFPAAMEPPASPSIAPPERKHWLLGILAVAASWLAMFMIGGLWQASKRPNVEPNTRPVGLPPAIEQMLVRDQWEEASRSGNRGAVAGQPWPREANPAADSRLAGDLPIPADILAMFREQGLEPKVLDAHVPVQLNDGRRLIIPVTKRDRRMAPR